MIRFVNKLRKRFSYSTNTLSVEEKTKAEIILWSIEQEKHFHEKENSVHGLQVVQGDDDVLRVKTRIIERDDDLSFLYPILLPSNHYLTEFLIREYHLKYCHAGVQILAAKLRLQYWIFSSKRNIRSCVSRCVVCKRFTAKALTSPIQLPLDRRPLAYISDDSDELIPLTPSLFLQDIKQVGVPDLDSVDTNKLNVRVNHCNTLRSELRSRFHKEYLSQLVQKAIATCQELKVGDIVLIELENKKRVMWPMGKIEKIYSSRDGASRVVQVRTSSGCLTRPIQKLYPLEMSTSGDPVLTRTTENRSRYGRLFISTKK
ncbi:endonuclease [Caerostris extrusa]|uniref:Endonuclease n=1 Tax=Caerostris extrusa TaxID=172846 RepID=A0AAV4MY83_CAEEX|nr:endonuclease [Caerostris extrusa]